MKKDFSTSWKASVKPRKQRKYRSNAPLHLRGRFLTAKLAKELSQKHKMKRLRLKVGDKVKVLRGSGRGKEGKIESINLANSTVKITGYERAKKDGSKSKIPLHASNLLLTDINTDDKKRIKNG